MGRPEKDSHLADGKLPESVIKAFEPHDEGTTPAYFWFCPEEEDEDRPGSRRLGPAGRKSLTSPPRTTDVSIDMRTVTWLGS
ncbi:MAG: hypothetical protein Q9184_005852 [Pyrenodesmia sp. 2 TL-2023]